MAQQESELAQVRRALEEAERRDTAHREREMLLRGELQHRVRNTLAVVRSIFARSIAAGSSIEELAEHFPARLDVLARYQFSRTQEPGGSVDLESMVRDELQSLHAGDDARVTIAGPEARLSHDIAQSIALALHELATNSVKFGVLGTRDPRARLAILWQAADGRLAVRWEESGVAVLGSAPPRTGFGREFIEQALPYQHGADTSFTLRPGGLCCTIALPPVASATGLGA